MIGILYSIKALKIEIFGFLLHFTGVTDHALTSILFHFSQTARVMASLSHFGH
jgi:hypothetical protein